MFKLKNLLDTSSLEESDIRAFIDTAKVFAPFVKRNEPIPLLKNQTVVNLFFENSTRTRFSFEQACRKLGASTLNFAVSSSSVQKGETLIDTAKNIEAMGPHAIVVRHASAGSPHTLSKAVKVPVINAGDGFHEHPTQGLLDVFTMEEKLGSLKNKRIVILGDIAHSRVARSNIYLLRKLGASIAVCAPPTLLPPHPETLGVDYAYRPEELLKEADVIMSLRIQLERQNRMQLPSLNEYTAFWGLNKERAKLLKPSCIIMHPGPVNRGVELDSDLADSSHSVILDQVFNGVVIRMAVLSLICNPQETTEFIQTQLRIKELSK
jgi:aspartate carbamoyltransferase catalytic subunit